MRDGRAEARTADRLCLLAFCIGYVLLSLLGYTGFYASDDTHYLTAIRQIGSGQMIGPSDIFMAGLRLAVTVPAGLVYYLSGGDLVLVTSSFMAYGVGLIIMVHWLGRRLHNRRTALLAAFFVGSSGLLAVYGGTVLPDVVLAFWLTAALCAVVAATVTADSGKPRLIGLLFAAGIFLGFCYMSKSVGILAVIPIGAALIWTIRPFWKAVGGIAAVAMGLGLVLAVEAVVVPLVAEGGLTRLAEPARLAADYRLLALETGRLDVMDRLRAAFLYLQPTFQGFLWLFLGGALLYPFLAPRNPLLWMTFWLLALYRLAGSVSLEIYAPPALQARYFLFGLPLAAIMTAYCIDRAASVVEGLPGSPKRARLARWSVSAVVGLVAAGWLWTGIAAAVSHAGTLFFAELVPTFERALLRAREECADCPIIVSPVLSRRLGPLMEYGEGPPPGVRLVPSATSRTGDVAWTEPFPEHAQPLPEPPFIFLDSAHEPVPTWQLEAFAVRDSGVAAAVRSLAHVDPLYPPPRKANFVQRALLSSTDRKVDASLRAYAVEVREVSASPDHEPDRDARVLLDLLADQPLVVPLTEGASVELGERGMTVTWRLPDEEPQDIYLQLFDGSSWKRAPRGGRSGLGPETGQVRIDMKMERVPEHTAITLFTYLYASDEVLEWKSASADAAGTDTPLSIAFMPDRPADAFKVRIRIRPAASAGEMVIGNLRVVLE